VVRPNRGFFRQLQLFELMGNQVSKDSAIYKTFKLENLADQVKLGGNSYNLSNFGDFYRSNITENNNNEDNKITSYKCKKCRYTLFNTGNVITHIKAYQEKCTEWKSKLDYYKKLKSNNVNADMSECSQELYIEPLSWFIDKLEDLEGKVSQIMKIYEFF